MKHVSAFATKFQSIALIAGLLCSMGLAALPRVATAAAVSAPFTPGAKVSFTFDDGLQSTYAQAAPVLAKYNYPATNYVITGCVGMTTTPNTCAADGNKVYMTWDQIAALQNTYGWEVASHTVSHPQLSTDRLSGVLTAQQMVDEINNSKTDLNNRGFAATDFAAPYGDYDNTSIAAVAKTYASHRGFADIDYNTFPYNDYLLTVQQVQGNVSVATVKGYIDQAKAQGKWLILVFHEIKADDDPTYDASQDAYEYKAGDLDQIAAYVQSQGVPVTDIAHGLATSATNMFANGTFNSGIADGWTTDDATNIVADRNGNGSYDGTVTGATNSIALTGTAADTHLFSPLVAVDPTQTYVVKSFVNVTSTSGEVDFFVDEYDASGNWISGKYQAGVAGTATATTVAVKDVNFAYTPTSAAVASAKLQVIVHGSGAKAYVDNVQLFPLSAIGVTIPADTTAPTVSLTAPAAAAIVSGTTTMTAAASDNTAVTKVEFYVDGTLAGTSTTSPYAFNWNTATVTNGTHSLTAKAYDAAGNTATSTAVTVTVSNTTPDTTKPTVPANLTASTATAGQVSLSWTASTDNIGVTGYDVLRGGIKIATVSGTTYADTTVAANTTYSYTVVAHDAAGNTSDVSTAAIITTPAGSTPTPKAGDVNNDGVIDLKDATIVSLHWGMIGMTRAQGDLNNDGVVDFKDATIIALNWSK